MARFAVKRVNAFEWTGGAAAVVLLSVANVPWFVPTGYARQDLEADGLDPAPSGWGLGVLSWLSVLLLVAGAVVVLLPHLSVRLPWRAAIWIGTAALAAVLIPLSRNSFESAVAHYGYYVDENIWFYVAVSTAWLSLAAAALNTRAKPA